jgi:hypothetical protein
MDVERASSPLRSDSVSALACICDRKRDGEKVVEERRKRLPVGGYQQPAKQAW